MTDDEILIYMKKLMLALALGVIIGLTIVGAAGIIGAITGSVQWGGELSLIHI